MKTSKKQKKAQTTELPEELVLEILIRLPVKSLRRFKCVSKAWRTTMSGPYFIRSHLQFSASRWEQNPSLLITPHTLDRDVQGENWPTNFSNNIRFYQWWQGASKARLVHGRDFDDEFRSVCCFAHCDGLVLLPTDTKVYLFNPATRDVLTLPESSRNKRPGIIGLPVGFGRDPRTGMYKVVRSFFRSRDAETGVHSMGMEVCTVGGGGLPPCWRETASDQPYPVAAWVTAQTVKGCLYWIIIDRRHLKPRPHGLLRFGLEDETFSVTRLPDSLDSGDDDCFNLDVMGGELCLTGSRLGEPDVHPLTIWALVEDDGPRSLWEQRYTIYVTYLCHPISLLPNSGGAMMIWLSSKLYRYDLQSSELTVVCDLERLRYERRRTGSFGSAEKDVYFFNVIPYTESLVSITD
ncbi:putative F-box protein At1g50870 [Lolium perenne]|uniref:putative F-box protein At1g50870 n=1 Tax=Lolium perenne TaxID=4522 RepID=UPI0021F68107|nr:putative F-box protein At1g50870 [Lolium perenne]